MSKRKARSWALDRTIDIAQAQQQTRTFYSTTHSGRGHF